MRAVSSKAGGIGNQANKESPETISAGLFLQSKFNVWTGGADRSKTVHVVTLEQWAMCPTCPGYPKGSSSWGPLCYLAAEQLLGE